LTDNLDPRLSLSFASLVVGKAKEREPENEVG